MCILVHTTYDSYMIHTYMYTFMNSNIYMNTNILQYNTTHTYILNTLYNVIERLCRTRSRGKCGAHMHTDALGHIWCLLCWMEYHVVPPTRYELVPTMVGTFEPVLFGLGHT
jgi:hypothetical protein